MMDYVINYCSPTLAHLKVANLFSYPFVSIETLIKEITWIKETLCQFEISVELLKVGRKRALIYVYRQEALEQVLSQQEVAQYLLSIGYRWNGSEDCLLILKERLNHQEEFPHEIGLFLGYPFEDVMGFIIYQGKDYAYKGYWKVYTHVETKKVLFEKYLECKQLYLCEYKRGVPIERLLQRVYVK